MGMDRDLGFAVWAYDGEWLYTKIGIDMNEYNTVFIVHVGVWLAWKSSKRIFKCYYQLNNKCDLIATIIRDTIIGSVVFVEYSLEEQKWTNLDWLLS